MTDASWSSFAAVAEAVGATTKKLEKAAILADYFPTLADDDLVRAARYYGARPFALHDQRKLNVGSAQLRDALIAVYPTELEAVRALPDRFGDMGDVVEAVLARRPAQPPPTWTLERMDGLLTELAATRGSKRKSERIAETLAEMDVLEGKYFAKLLLGELRIGLREGLIEDALARQHGLSVAAIQRTNMMLGDLGETALRARHGTLADAGMRLFHPLTFMLASPIEDSASLAKAFDPPYYVEDKYDGIRGQLHKGADGRLALFTRTLDEVIHRFPELEAGARATPGEWILDGEILGWRDGTFLPFNAFQQRLGRKQVSAELMQAVPVIFVAFDLLYHDGALWIERPLAERRAALDQLSLSGNLRHSDLLIVHDADAVVEEFGPARERGVEGLMIKDPRSDYKPGRRGKEWLKLKRPLATLDVVVTGAEWGHGKRRNVLSDYTFAVRQSEDDPTLLNVGKAYSGLTDVEIAELTQWFEANTIQSFGRFRTVQPEIVLEVAFDVVQPSKRHKSGYALRFPRIVRLRTDKTAAEVDTLATVAALATGTPDSE